MVNKYDVASIAAINGLEGDDFHKLTAAQQKDLFGANILGRQSINFEPEGQGIVRVASSKAFGTDSNVVRLSYEQFAGYVNRRERIES